VIQREFGITQPAVSQHLRNLDAAPARAGDRASTRPPGATERAGQLKRPAEDFMIDVTAQISAVERLVGSRSPAAGTDETTARVAAARTIAAYTGQPS
jgi:hypothetical protein